MKVLCIMSHHQPFPDGKFDVYAAGIVYDLSEVPDRYFQDIEPRVPRRKAVEKIEDEGGIKNGIN